jgi:ribosome maturation factor RimP
MGGSDPAHFLWLIGFAAPAGKGGGAGPENEAGGRVLTTGNWLSTIERTVAGLDYELVDVERSAAGLLRVFVDRVPGHAYPTGESESVTVDDCERVTRQLQVVLQVEGVDYARLEVSSPGLDRALKRPGDYQRFAGAQISLSLKAPLDGRKRFRGQLVHAAPGWRLQLVDDAGVATGQALDFALDEVREARLVPVLDFKGRARKAGVGRPQPADGGAGLQGGQGR